MKSRFVVYSFFLVLLGVAIYFRVNAAQIYAGVGNYYYKNNNVSKAQMFYEKSFALGNNDSSVRKSYVNSIINSPLTIEAQEKLVDIVEGKTQDDVAFGAKNFLYDLKREIHRLYPNNYIKQAPLNSKIVHWSKFPISYKFVNTKNVPNEFLEEINNAFLEWEKTDAVMFVQSNEENADIIIDFINNNSKDGMEYGEKYIVAYTVPKIASSVLERMNINFYLQDPDGNDFSRNQIYNTALHEIFHALGCFGHSFEKDNIMYLAKNNKALVNDLRLTITEADKNTLKLLYKIKPDITNDTELKFDYIPYLVLGDDEEVNSSKAKEAKNYIYHAPTLPNGYIDLAESLISEKRYPEAIRNLEKALELSETKEMLYISYYNLAVAYYYIGHNEMAMDYLNKAGELKDNEDLHHLKAEILIKTNPDLAEEEYSKLIQTYPDKSEYTTRLANIYLKKRHYLKARKLLKDFIKRNPKYKNDSEFSAYGILLL